MELRGGGSLGSDDDQPAGAGDAIGVARAKDGPQFNVPRFTAEFAHSKGGSKLCISKTIYIA
jgi:hypothetical protein